MTRRAVRGVWLAMLSGLSAAAIAHEPVIRPLSADPAVGSRVQDVLRRREPFVAQDFHGLSAANVQAIVEALAGLRPVKGKPFQAVAHLHVEQSGAPELQLQRLLARDSNGRLWQRITVPLHGEAREFDVVADPDRGDITLRLVGSSQVLRIERRTVRLESGHGTTAQRGTAPVPGHSLVSQLGQREILGLLASGVRRETTHPAANGAVLVTETWTSAEFGIDLDVKTYANGRLLSRFWMATLSAQASDPALFSVPKDAQMQELGTR